MRKRGWKHTAFALASLMALGSMAGAAAGAKPVLAEEDKGEAMGRYLEEELTLPEETATVEKICFLTDGTMRMAYRSADYALKIADSKDNGQTWDTPRDLQSEILGLADAEPSVAALSKDGGIFAVSSMPTEDPDAFLHKYHYVTPEGEVRELDGETSLGADFYAFKADFTAAGNVILLGVNSLVEISMEDGSLVRTYDDGSVQGFGLAGNLLISIVDGTLHYYDTETGEPVSDESALTQQVASREENLYLTSTSSWPIVFAQQEEKGILYADRSGLYLYNKGGSVVEQLIDGSLVSIGSPMVSFLDMAAGPDGAFYLAAQDYGSGEPVGKIFKYTYHEDVSAVPSTELDVYMLEDDAFMQQVAALFQKKYPDIYVNLQTGMTGDNAVTETDAIKTLNTEIMAGNGPDVMVLDGIPDGTYVERGMLEDISGIVKEAGLLENIKSAYEEEDGSIYRMPTRFAMPMILGKEQDMEKVTDLTTLADTVEGHKAEYSNQFYATTKGAAPGLLLETLSDTSAASWMNEDGTLNEEKIKEFLEQTNRIYQAQLDAINAYFEFYGVNLADMEAEYDNVSRQDYPVNAGVSTVGSMELLSYGGLYSPNDLFMLTSAQQKRPELVYKIFDGQAQNCFYPESMVGISAKAEEKEAAELFVEFLFSEDAQSTAKNTGFPVKQSVYESPEYWEMGKEGEVVSVMSWSDSSGTEGEMLEITNSSDEQLKEVQELGKTLTTPAFDNRIILTAVRDAGKRYLKGETDLDTAVREAVSQVNLYLSE